jgi:hypothetical protein
VKKVATIVKTINSYNEVLHYLDEIELELISSDVNYNIDIYYVDNTQQASCDTYYKVITNVYAN